MSLCVSSDVEVTSYIKPSTWSAGTRTSAAIDTGKYNSLEFFVDAGTFGASATLTNKLQWSVDGSTNWTDDDGSTGNTAAPGAISATAVQHFKVTSPKAQYYRLSSVSAVQTVDYGVTMVADPKKKPPTV